MNPTLLDIRTAADLGRVVRGARRSLGLRQSQLALASGTGIRFIVDLERGKETCRLGKALRVLEVLGVGVSARTQGGRGG